MQQLPHPSKTNAITYSQCRQLEAFLRLLPQVLHERSAGPASRYLSRSVSHATQSTVPSGGLGTVASAVAWDRLLDARDISTGPTAYSTDISTHFTKTPPVQTYPTPSPRGSQFAKESCRSQLSAYSLAHRRNSSRIYHDSQAGGLMCHHYCLPSLLLRSS
jgi:hypothetical protein